MIIFLSSHLRLRSLGTCLAALLVQLALPGLTLSRPDLAKLPPVSPLTWSRMSKVQRTVM